jgi:Flp pilus assembly protein TadD
MLTLRRETVWNNSLSLWTDALSRNPTSETAAVNLGYAHLEAGQLMDAAQCFNIAVKLTGGRQPDPHAGFALVFARSGRMPQAREAYRRACALEPRFTSPELLRASLRWNASDVAVFRELLSDTATTGAHSP